MQEGLLLVLEFEVQKEARPLNKIISVILGGTFDDLSVVFQLAGCEYITDNLILKRIIVH